LRGAAWGQVPTEKKEKNSSKEWFSEERKRNNKKDPPGSGVKSRKKISFLKKNVECCADPHWKKVSKAQGGWQRGSFARGSVKEKTWGGPKIGHPKTPQWLFLRTQSHPRKRAANVDWGKKTTWKNLQKKIQS